MHSTLIPKISTNKFTSAKFFELEEQFTADAYTNILFLGLPNSGKTYLLGSLVTYLYNKNELLSTYDKYNMSVNAHKHFVSLQDYFNGLPDVAGLPSTPHNEIFEIKIQLENTSSSLIERFNFIDCSGVWTQQACEVYQRQQIDFIPSRKKSGNLQLELPFIKQSIFPDYLTAVIESSRKLEVFLVIDSNSWDTTLVKACSTIVQELSEYQQYVGFECNISIVFSKVDTLVMQPNHQMFLDGLRKQLPTNLARNLRFKIFESGLLDFQNRNKFIDVGEPNPYVLAIAKYLSKLI